MQLPIKPVLLLSLCLSLLTAGISAVAAEAPAKRLPFALSLGQNTYNKSCLECHGKEGVGSDKGPPLMHKFYEPSHHSDDAFYRAMTTGTKQHHWAFGDMQPVPGLTAKQMSKIIEYLRWLQRQQGIGLR